MTALRRPRPDLRLVSGLFLTLFAVGVLLMGATMRQSLAQTPDGERALAFVNGLYQTETALRLSGQGILVTPGVSAGFLTPEAQERVSVLDGSFDPLTGGPAGPITRFDLRLGTAPSADRTRVEAAVLSGGQARLVRLDVVPVDGDQLRVAELSGADWSLTALAAPAEAPPADAASGSLFDSLDSPDTPTADVAVPEGTTAPSTPTETASAPASVPATEAETAALTPVEDTFDGTTLGPRWTVLNENPDTYVVDGGEIFAIASGGDDTFGAAEAANVFQLDGVPEGDFEASLDVRLDAKTGFDGVMLGLRASETDYLAAHAYVYTKGCGAALYLDILNLRPLGEDEAPVRTVFSANLFDGRWVGRICSGGDGRAYGDLVLQALAEDGARLTIARDGFRYTGRLEMTLPASGDIEGGPVSFETRALSRIDPPGPVAFLLSQWPRARAGEATASFEAFSLRPAE
ncbi:MAG: hypothetical protein AAF321_07170 [Pseudomonadota bacterium]